MNYPLHISILLLLAVLPIHGVGCVSDDARQVRGQVVEVVARNFSEIEVLRIRDEEGREYRFETEGFVGFTPSHLKEHQLLGQSLLVTYRERENALVAIRLED